MKKLTALLMAFVLLLCFAGCESNGTPNNNDTGSNVTENNNASNNQNETPDNNTEVSGDSKVLIVYFSHSNNTHKLTEMIGAEVDADVIRLTPAKPYENDTLFERAQDELNDGTRPEISNLPDAETVAQYDTILVGFPIWWYDLPMPMWTFLEAYDLSGKTVIPYFTHNGSSSGAGSIDTIEELCPDSTVKSDDYLSIAGRSVDGAESEVKEWLAEIGLSK